LTDEAITHFDGSVSQSEQFEYDLTGNRTSVLQGTDSISYEYDANDRLLFEWVDLDYDPQQNPSVDQTTAYGYDHTQQTAKTTYDGEVDAGTTSYPAITGRQLFAYNLQGRMSGVINETYAGGSVTARTRTWYDYDQRSFRISSVTESDGTPTNADNLWDANASRWTETESIEYVADHHNHTGYTQTLRETKTENGHTQITDYTFGHDEITQRVHGTQGDGTAIDQTHIFGHDGHGSVRVLYDLADAIANAAQVLTFSAYGQMLAVHAVAGGAVATQAASLTSIGYSGEHFDAQAAQQYLRARFYNPATGAFNRLDPFAGNREDPQSLHKYLYVHGDPVQGVDPTGLFTSIQVGITTGIIGALAGGTVSYINGGSVLGGAAIGFGVGFSLGYLGGSIALHGARYVVGKVFGAIFLGPGKLPFVAAGGSVSNILTLLWRAAAFGGAAIEAFLFLETMWKGYEDGEPFRHSLDHFLAIHPWAIKPEPGLLGAASIRGPQGVIQRYKDVINGQRAIPPELLASVLLAELKHYNVSDTIMDTFMFGSDPSIGIAQIRVGTVIDRGYAPGLKREEIADMLFHPGTAIQLLAADLKHVADTKGIDLSQWDALPLEQKEILVAGFTRSKDLIDPDLWFDPEQGFGGLGPWGVEAYEHIRRNGLLE
jgi:RHS repeat-associated protein